MAITIGARPDAVATSGSPATYEGPGYGSPQDAVSAYTARLAAGDLGTMVGSFAIESFVDHLDPHAYLGWIGSYSIAATLVLVPPDGPISRAWTSNGATAMSSVWSETSSSRSRRRTST
jgi:hypothetical protein